MMAVTVLAVPAVAQDTSLAAAFGAREGVQSASLSPDGSKIALIASGPQQTTKLFIVDTAAVARNRFSLQAASPSTWIVADGCR
jgi:dipeptidyl aminopeptidase/acylaminoacyl peptidase